MYRQNNTGSKCTHTRRRVRSPIEVAVGRPNQNQRISVSSRRAPRCLVPRSSPKAIVVSQEKCGGGTGRSQFSSSRADTIAVRTTCRPAVRPVAIYPVGLQRPTYHCLMRLARERLPFLAESQNSSRCRYLTHIYSTV